MDVKTATAWWLLLRDMLLVLTGLGILVHEALSDYVGPGRHWVYLVAGGIGFSPLFTRKGDRTDIPGDARPGPGKDLPA